MYTIAMSVKGKIMSNIKGMNELEQIDEIRVNASVVVRNKRQKLNEQYFTPGFVTNYLVRNLLCLDKPMYSILDVAAGVGNIGAAVALAVRQKDEKATVNLVAVEIDDELSKESNFLFQLVLDGVDVNYQAANVDFFDYYREIKQQGETFTTIVMNPPYKKLSRKDFNGLELEGVEYSPNLYSLMMSCALNLLGENGELIAIVPRSFCSGTLFYNFRKKILDNYSIVFIHLFESRDKVFSFDGVQQETVIIKIIKREVNKHKVIVSYGDDLSRAKTSIQDFSKIVFPCDKQRVIHIPHNEIDEKIIKKILSYKDNLESLGLKISTGKVVDFRNKMHLTSNNINNAWLYCKENLDKYEFIIPGQNFKNFIEINEQTTNKLLDEQCHVIVNRMFFKEKKQIVVAQVVDCTDKDTRKIAVENHLNYISGETDSKLDYKLALGIKFYLESDLVSDYFKRFIGSTQINASDIKSLPFPSRDELIKIGEKGVY